jgi:hypothetical protein
LTLGGTHGFISICLAGALYVCSSVTAAGAVIIDSFSDEQARLTITTEQNTSRDIYAATILGGHRDEYVRNYLPVAPTSAIIEVTEGALQYTSYTAAEPDPYVVGDNAYLLLLYGSLPAAEQLNLDIEGFKQSAAFRFELGAVAAFCRVEITFYTSDGHFGTRVFLDGTTIDVPIADFKGWGSQLSAVAFDLSDIEFVEFTFVNMAETGVMRSLSVDSISIVPEPSMGLLALCAMGLLSLARRPSPARRSHFH